MKDSGSVDRIKYRRMWAVYITDMKQLQYDHPEIWKHFCDGHFSIQKSMVPGTAKGRDHAGEQEVKKKLKTRGGIKGITRNDNSRMLHFLVAPILSEFIRVMGNGIEVERNELHRQLRKTHTANQNKRISSLLDVFKNNNFELFPLEKVIKNLVTGQVYPDDVCYDNLSAEKIGEQLYDNFIIERLSENNDRNFCSYPKD